MGKYSDLSSSDPLKKLTDLKRKMRRTSRRAEAKRLNPIAGMSSTQKRKYERGQASVARKKATAKSDSSAESQLLGGGPKGYSKPKR